MIAPVEQLVRIRADNAQMEGLLEMPDPAHGLVLFAHGSGSSRHSPRNNAVARVLRDNGLGTLLLDLLTVAEDADFRSRFDIPLLTERLLLATHWVQQQGQAQCLPIGYFGASTGAAAALQAAAALGADVAAVVSRGGRPDLAGNSALTSVKAPTLLLVGSRDEEVLELNRAAYVRLPCCKELSIIAGATHLFAERGTLDAVAEQAAAWFKRHMGSVP